MEPLTPQEIEAIQKENADLKLANKAQAEKITQLETENESLLEKNITHEETIEKLNTIVANPASTENKSITAELGSIEHKGVTYAWKRKTFRLAGSPEVFTIAQAKADPKLLARLLSFKGQDVLVEQE